MRVGHDLLTEVWLSFVEKDLKNDISIGCSRVVRANKEIY